MTNLELVISILAKHREARAWTDEAVAADVLAQLGVDPAGIVQMTEAEVVAAEAVAKETADRATAYRAALVAALQPTPIPEPEQAAEATPEPTSTPPGSEAPERLASAPDGPEQQDERHE